jgi:uncharacterized membrane protein
MSLFTALITVLLCLLIAITTAFALNLFFHSMRQVARGVASEGEEMTALEFVFLSIIIFISVVVYVVANYIA